MKKNQSLLIVGLVRDCEKHIVKEVNRLDKHASTLFNEVFFYLVESDSKDKTQDKLAEIARNKSNFKFKSLGQLSITHPDRFSRLRYCRNQYVKAIRENSCFKLIDFILIVDFDIKNRHLNMQPLLPFLAIDDWSGLFVNQLGPYYDILALRKSGWVERDCFADYAELSKFLKRKDAKQIAVWGKMKRIPLSSEPIEVQSAFGGMALYKREVFSHYDYGPDAGVTSDESEHLNLHRGIISSGGKLFIVPTFINFGFSPHNLLAIPLFRMLDIGTKSILFGKIRRMLRKSLS